MQRRKILLAGQQNAGKSTLFNQLTGARQFVANYPGVTVDKKTGYFSDQNGDWQLIDLPGTYSLTSFSLEERVARKALREERADVVLNVMDAANINRSLHLTLQLIELELPVALALNMMDVARSEGIEIHTGKLAEKLAIPVAECIGHTGQGVEQLSDTITQAKPSAFKTSYPELEDSISDISEPLNELNITGMPAIRWLALRLLEEDQEASNWLSSQIEPDQWNKLKQKVATHQAAINTRLDSGINDYIVAQRQKTVADILSHCVEVKRKDTNKKNVTERVDSVVLNRFGAPLFLIATVFVIYQCSIVYGYELTNYWWPYLASFRELVAGVLPEAGFLHDPYVRSLGLWIIDSANTLLNYIPIFLILFALIAILEDSGYMARIAFISDRLLNKFGLHGQSTLPLILGGVFAGGCAVPGIMATKGIPDNRARLATILTVPYMNCLAKIPLYTLLLGIFFTDNMSLMTFYISTFSVIAALLVAKLLTRTVLQKTETAPFVMELPRYNLPTLRSVITRSLERTWMYVRKVGTIVLAVSTVIFVLLQFPGISEDKEQVAQQRAEQAVATFDKAIRGTHYAEKFDHTTLPALVNFYTDFKRAKLNARGTEASAKVNSQFKARNETFMTVVAPAKGDREARKANRALRKLSSARNAIRRDINEQRLEASILGSLGRSLEPISQYAGFDWKINVALFSSFAARESSVATLGVLFQQDEESNQKLEQRMGESNEFASKGAVAAVALILFFILYPPCLASVMMIKVQTGQYKWMLLSILLPTLIGFTVASIAYSTGNRLNLTGTELMSLVWFSGLALLLLIGFKDRVIKKVQPSQQIPITNL